MLRELHGSHFCISSYNQTESVIICWWQLYYLLLIKEEGMGVNMLLALPIKIGLINLSFVSEIFYADILVTKNEARSL